MSWCAVALEVPEDGAELGAGEVEFRVEVLEHRLLSVEVSGELVVAVVVEGGIGRFEGGPLGGQRVEFPYPLGVGRPHQQPVDDVPEVGLGHWLGEVLVELHVEDVGVGFDTGHHGDAAPHPAVVDAFEDGLPGKVGEPAVQQDDIHGGVERAKGVGTRVSRAHVVLRGEQPPVCIREALLVLHDEHRGVSLYHRVHPAFSGPDAAIWGQMTKTFWQYRAGSGPAQARNGRFRLEIKYD